MMQIPPPSPAQISLLSEFFSRRNSNSNTTTATAKKKKKVYCHDRNHPDQIPSLLEARQDLASNSSSKNSVGDDGDKSTGISSSCAPRRPSLFANPEAAMIRYENYCLHPSLLLHEEYCDVSASAPFQTLPVQRPQQLQQQHPRKMARRKSPPLKIIRNHGPAFVVAHGAASPCRPTDPERGHGGEQQQQQLLQQQQQQQQHETIDENGNPQLPPSSECPLTCFSYRTMEKQYEKDTLRMLERIQKSRSFEQQQQRGFYKNQGKQPRNCRQHGSPSAANRQQSFASFRERAVIRTKDNADTDTGNAKQAIHRHDGGFYIGDDADNGIETTGLVLDETIHDPNYAHANNDFGVAGETPKDGVDENGPSLFEEEEIFELDL